MTTAAREGRSNWRDRLRQVHLCIGALLCLPLAILGLTGSVLVFEDELRALLEPKPHASAVGPAHSLGEIIAAARPAAPAGQVPAFVSPALELGNSTEVRFADPKQRGPGGWQVFVDPVSLAVLDARDARASLVRQIATLHSDLAVRELGGRSIVGWLGVAMVLLGVTGPILWWPSGGRWRAVFSVRRGAGAYALLRDLHGLVGICGFAVLVAVSASGVYIAFPQQISAALSLRDARPGVAPPRIAPQQDKAPLDLDAAVALAQAAVPDGTLRLVGLPTRADQPLRASFAPANAQDGAPPVTVFVDPWARRVVELRDPRTLSSGESLLVWLRPLHAGAGLGWGWRFVTFLSGFLPPLFAGSGVAMWLLRRRARLRQRPATAARRPVAPNALEEKP